MKNYYFADDRPLTSERVDGRFRYLIEHVQDAVAEFELVDGVPIVLDVNGAFVDVFGYERREIVGSSLNEYIVPEWLSGEADELDERTRSGEINYRRVRRQTATGLRDFLYRGIPYRYGDEGTDGFAVYTDLTELRQRERRLQVLNRVLRHNLRTELTVLQGATAALDETLAGTDVDAADDLATLESSIGKIRDIVREASAIDETLTTSQERESVDCVSLLRRIAGRFEKAHPEATIETEFPEAQAVVGTSQYGAAFGALIENAIEHNPSSPWVGVRVVPVDGGPWADVIVEDDGPQIPAAERDVVTGDAEIDQLTHSSGLGLWLVKWTVERAGGDISFDTSDAGGNRVRLRLPTSGRSST